MWLAAVGLATALAYGAWVAWVPLLPINLYVPLLDLGKITGYTWPSTALYVGLVSALYALYAVGYRLVASGKASTVLVFAFGIAFCVEMLGVYPATAADVFGYIAHGRLLAEHGANPFVVTPFAYSSDAIYRFLAFPSEPSQYGPLWVLLGAGLSFLASATNDPLLAEILLYKLVSASAHVAGAALILQIARHLGASPATARACAYLFLWNPTLVWEMVGNAHNDGVMMLGALLAARLLVASMWVLILPALALGALVKLPVAILAPLFFIAIWRHRKLFALESAALALLLVAVVYRPFWEGPATLTALQRSDLFTASFGAVLRLSLEPSLGLDLSSSIARWISVTLFGMVFGGCMLLAFRAQGNKHVLTLCYVTLLAAVLLATTWFQAWYVVWPFAIAAALPDGRRHLEVALLSLGGLLQYVVFIYLWVMAVLPPEQHLVIQSAAYAALMLPLLVGSALAFTRRARYAHAANGRS
jgi:alpha-1,6-mannosyltransferase